MLYFQNLSPNPADAYLADGLTEAIAVRLSQIERLVVKSPAAVRRYRGEATQEPAAVGRTVWVANLVHGSVRRGGQRLRMTVTLTRAATGVQLWGEQFDRSDADLLSIEKDIAEAVASAIAGRLLPSERASLAARPTRQPAAYDRFLRGNYLLAQRNPGAMAQAIEQYEAAVRIDSAFTDAWARLALAHELFIDWGWAYPGLPPETVLARGFAAADRGLRLNSKSSEAWMARGVLLSHRGRQSYDSASAALKRAIALGSRNAEAHHQYAGYLRELGDDSAAAHAYQQALAIDPARAITLHGLGRLHLTIRRYDEARRWLDSAVAVDPGFYAGYARRAVARLYLGDTAGARADARAAIRLGVGDPAFGPAVLALVEASTGDTAAARQRARQVLAALPDRDPLSVGEGVHSAMALIAVAEHERALDILDRIRPRAVLLWSELRSPVFDTLRSHPRFQRLVEESRPPRAPR